MMDWLLVGLGFMGALALWYTLRIIARNIGMMAHTSAHFTQKGDCTDAIVRAIRKAKSEILVQAHSFTCPAIAEALADARRRGVFVSILLDRGSEKQTYSELSDLPKKGLLPLVSSQHLRLHDQVLIVDRQTVITGSFPFTPHDGKDHAANVLVLHGQDELADEYRRNFLKHQANCIAPASA
jgi:phosphatidylserine/phosphatidylglycerophosphate/cardiolipin synthase-like enzyme